MTRCIGWGEEEGRCNNEAGTPWTPLWCQACDEQRRAHLDAQFTKIAAGFTAAAAVPNEAQQA